MTTRAHASDTVDVPGLPAIPGLRARHLAGRADYPQLLAVIQGSKAADHVEDADTLETLAHSYDHLANCDPARDFLLLEVDGRVVSYGRVHWRRLDNGGYAYPHVAFTLPEWRGRGLGRAMLGWQERRAAEIAREQRHPAEAQRWLISSAMDTERARLALLERAGYRPTRYFYLMVRPNLDDIPEAPLPPGLEIRPVQREHLRLIWNAQTEAFKDHWGAAERTEADYQRWLGDDEFQPDIWKVAWDTAANEVVGMVLGFIHAEHNAQFNRRRGWTENIAVRRPWRKRGVATALIAANLRELKARGMTEAALGVDVENPTGALRLYEAMGFRPVERETVVRKELR